LVPSCYELNHEHGSNWCPGHWNQNAPKELHWRCAINLAGLGYFSWNGHKVLPKKENRSCGYNHRQDKSSIAIEQVQVSDYLVGRHDSHFYRQHQRDKNAPKAKASQRKIKED